MKPGFLALFFCAFLLVAALHTACSSAGEQIRTHVFTAGDYGYHTFRIPALVVSGNSTLLAFAEGRRDGQGDTGAIDMVLRRSTDGGRTWGDPILVWSDGNTCGNPCPVVVEGSGRILLLATWNLSEDHEPDIHWRRSKDTRRVYVLHSDDDGLSWSSAREITEAAKDTVWAWYATGPGHAIQIKAGPHRGRIVVPCDHTVPREKSIFYSHLIYSDDEGETWHIGGVSEPGGNECSAAELPDGSLMLNMRQDYEGLYGPYRLVALSRDGGFTLGPTAADTALTEPVCQGTLLTYMPEGKPTSTLLFANPADTARRINMTVKISRDGGATWPESHLVWGSHAAYGDLAMLPGGEVGILYENGEKKEAYERITFERLPGDLFEKR